MPMILKLTCLYPFPTPKKSLENLQHCVMAVSAWMTGSKLKINPSMTEFLLIGTKLQREKFLNNFPCLIQDTNPSASAKNLGVSLLDYCNSLFYNIPENDIDRLQRVLNRLARVVTKAPRFSRSTTILKRLH